MAGPDLGADAGVRRPAARCGAGGHGLRGPPIGRGIEARRVARAGPRRPWGARTRPRSWRPSCRDGSTRGSGIGSWPSAAATRSPCSSCPSRASDLALRDGHHARHRRAPDRSPRAPVHPAARAAPGPGSPAAARGGRRPGRRPPRRCGGRRTGSASTLDAATAAEAAGLIELRDGVRFRHPLVRSAVYRTADPGERRVVHQALAEAADPDDRPGPPQLAPRPRRRGPRRARRRRAPGSADRALALGGLASAASFLESAADADAGSRRAGRSDCWTPAGPRPPPVVRRGARRCWRPPRQARSTSTGRAVIELLRAQIAYNSSHGNEALPMMLAAARRLEPLDPVLARSTYLDAMSAAMFAGRLATDAGVGDDARCRAVRAGPPAAGREPRPTPCSTGWPCCTPTATPPRLPCCTVRCARSATRS